ncbi:DUF6941 family protein [Cellulomonas bogoriensis]|uniref:Uncharacterized protein n=1 Tax=Cellulomonas bogoriensis 69B4 = DSM 16987 TaxID=1386082 RepID=A0A0A0C1S2_9CELL|nr:hypothetical protein [Cellulomonas bogoriensis]KGM13922.1 hypothetical protein N869_07785 [Cellulomonas bogoriensis 69B4 = DSM 16987]
MKLTVLLADAAEEANGKVSALGLGWTVTATPTPPMVVILLLDIGWDETDRDIDLHLELVDADGRPVMVPGPYGEQPLTVDARAKAGRPPAALPGTEIRMPMTISIAPGLQLEPGQRYEWRASLDGQHNAAWRQTFVIRPAVTEPPA